MNNTIENDYKGLFAPLVGYFYSPLNSQVQSNDDHHRYKSWEHCYVTFKYVRETYYSKEKGQFRKNIYNWNDLALNLGFYLASWGMYRGSSFLLQKDYLIHVEPIKRIFEDDSFWEDDFPQDKLKIQELSDKIANAYNVSNNVPNYDESQDKKDEELFDGSLTDTLFTKIILGICGNIPAYDRYCKKAISKLNWDVKNTPNEKRHNLQSFAKVVEIAKKLTMPTYFCSSAVKDWDGKEQTIEYEYPKMKLMDMFLFELGNLIECAENLKVTADKDYSKKAKGILGLSEFVKYLETTHKDNEEEIIGSILKLADRDDNPIPMDLIKRIKDSREVLATICHEWSQKDASDKIKDKTKSLKDQDKISELVDICISSNSKKDTLKKAIIDIRV